MKNKILYTHRELKECSGLDHGTGSICCGCKNCNCLNCWAKRKYGIKYDILVDQRGDINARRL